MIKFEYDKSDITGFNAGLIEELKNPSQENNFEDLSNEYSCDEVLDAMAVVAKEKDPLFDLDEEVYNYVWVYYIQLMTEAYCNTIGNNQFRFKSSE